MNERKQAADYEQELWDLYDDYAHNRIDRRAFVERAARFAVGGMTAEALLASLSPNYAWAQQVAPDDARIKTESITYASPRGAGQMRGDLAWPATAEGRLPAVLVVHENRGLNPYIADVARRLAAAGFLALAPDALTPLGGYPGTDDEGRKLQSQRDSAQMIQDFIAGARFLQTHPRSNGTVGVVGFCYGGGVANELAVRIPDVIAAAVPFYGRQPAAQDVARIKCPLLIHYAGLDKRINAGWPAYEQALRQNHVDYNAYIYEGVNHGFHNDTTPRYDQKAAQLAWSRTLEFFREHLQ